VNVASVTEDSCVYPEGKIAYLRDRRNGKQVSERSSGTISKLTHAFTVLQVTWVFGSAAARNIEERKESCEVDNYERNRERKKSSGNGVQHGCCCFVAVVSSPAPFSRLVRYFAPGRIERSVRAVREWRQLSKHSERGAWTLEGLAMSVVKVVGLSLSLLTAWKWRARTKGRRAST
jgi:hypothetical protein